MVFQIVSVAVPLVLLLTVPLIVRKLGGDSQKYLTWLVTACIIFFVSWYLPSPLIRGEDTSFTTHFVGGGLFSGLLWFYLKKSLRWKSDWLTEAFSLFILVSTLGVMNELFELLLKETGLSQISLTDTNWDLLANTFGALLFYVAYLLVYRWTKNNDSRD